MTVYTQAMPIEVEHDAEAGAFYVYLARRPVARTERVNDCVLVDLDERGEAVGIEVLRLDHLDLDACAAAYGFADKAGAVGFALGVAVPA